jgi:hypothetical protein
MTIGEKMMQLYPTLAGTQHVEDDTVTSRNIANDKFCLINVIFSGELAEVAMGSKEAATHAELDASLVGHKLPFWKMVEFWFNSRFPPDGVDGMTFADLMHRIHPLFHPVDATIDPVMHD